MASKRDVEILLRANDLTAKPLADVVAAVQKLTDKLTQQEAAAAKGEATTRELSSTLNNLNEASRALASQNAAIERYRDLAAQLEKSQAKATETAGALEKLRATQEGTTAATAAQTRELNKAETAAARAAQDVTKRTTALEKQGEVLGRAGIEIGQLAAAEATLIEAARKTGAARAQATTALEEYDSRLRTHKAALKDAAAAEKANAELTRQAAEAEAELAGRGAGRRAQAEAAAAEAAEKASKSYVQFWTTALDDVDEKRRLGVAYAKEAAEAEAMLAERAAARVASKWKTTAEVKAFQDQLAANRAKQAAAEYEKFWIGALSDVEAKQASATASLQAQAAAFRANRDAIAAAHQKALGYTAAQDDLAKKQTGYAGKPGFLGLRPYELQNLSFQINDIITQLGSGASLSQTLAQQGGQIFQLFQARLTGLVAVLPQLAIAAAVLGTVAAAMGRVLNTTQSMREFNAQFTLSADGARYLGEEVVKIQRRLQLLGLGFDEAGASLRAFIRAGVDQGQLEGLVATAFKISKVEGRDLKQVVTDLTQAFTGNVDEIVKLDKTYNVFSVTQQKMIEDANREEGVIKARAVAYGILQARADEAEKKLSGPVTLAFRAARGAWLEFLDAIGNSALGRTLIGAIQGSALVLQKSAEFLRDTVKSIVGKTGVEAFIEEQGKRLAFLQDFKEKSGKLEGRQALTPQATQRLDEEIASLTLNVDFAKRALAARQAQEATSGAAAATDILAVASDRAAKAGERFLQTQQDQLDAAKGINNARRAQIAGEKAYDDAIQAGADTGSASIAQERAVAEERRKIAEELKARAEGLATSLSSATVAADKTQKESLQARLAAIDEAFKKTERDLAGFEKVGGTLIDGKSLPDYRASLAAQTELLKQAETLKFFEENVNALVKSRENIYRDVKDAIADGTITAQAGYARAQASVAQLNPQIKSMASEALAFAKTLAGANPSPQLLSFITQMERAIGQTARTSQAVIGGSTVARAESLEQQLLAILAQGDKAQRESLAARLSAIDASYASALKKLQDFGKAGGKAIGGEGLDTFRARIEAQREIVKSNETLKFYEQNIGDLAKARETTYKDINDAVASGNLTAAQGYAAAKAAADEINPKIKALAADALKFAQALAEARPGPQTTAFLAQMRRQAGQAEEGPRTGLGSAAAGIAKTQLDEINTKLRERTEIERTWRNLVDKGVVTQAEANRQITAAYGETNEAIGGMTERFEEFLNVAGSSLPVAQLELFRAKIAEVRSDMREISPVAKQLKQTIEQSVANNAVRAFDTVAESIAGVITGTKKWGDAFREIGAAAALFFADLLRDIAKAIIQAQILALIKAATGAIFHEGGVVGSGGASRTVGGSWLGAPRYHSGQAAVGMSGNEVRAVLTKGEEVLTRDDPRNVLNGAKNYRPGAAGSAGQAIRQVLVLDEKQVPAAMQSSSGEKVILTHIKANAGTIRNLLGL